MMIKQITTNEQLKQAFRIRETVFVEEQHVPLEDEFDQFDRIDAPCRHILIFHEKIPVGTGRIRWIDGVGKLERICILKSYRSLGLGKSIIAGLEEIARENQTADVQLHGQTHAEGFYQNFGYETMSDVFMEDGIPHVVMGKKLVP